MNLGGIEVIIIAVVIVLLFGAGQLPKLARSLGGFLSEFNNAKEEAEDAFKTKSAKKKESQKTEKKSVKKPATKKTAKKSKK